MMLALIVALALALASTVCALAREIRVRRALERLLHWVSPLKLIQS